MPQLITIKEAAERFKLHPQTVRRMLHDGRIRGFHAPFSNAYLVNPDELEQLSKPVEIPPQKTTGAQLALDLDKAKRRKGKK